jgi:hypothetical protein
MTPHLRPLGLACFALSFAAASGCSSTASTSGGGSGGTSSTSSSSSTSTSSTSTSTSTSSSSSSSTGSSSSGSTACPTTSETMLPGVHLEIDGAACTFSLADPVAEVTIPYHIVVDQDVAGVTPRPQDASQCDQPGPGGLITFAKVDGNAQQYCRCDNGKCAPPQNPPVTLKAGSYAGTFTWDKHNWFGPSDSNNPEGPVFPVGDYTFTLSAIGVQTTVDGEMGWVITATMPIHLVP